MAKSEGMEPIKFSKSAARPQLEEGRETLTAGLNFIITVIEISDKTQYEKISKIDGYTRDGKDTSPVKYYTTSEVIAGQCEDIVKAYGTEPLTVNLPITLTQGIEVTTGFKKSQTSKYSYLTFL
jgi:hypothetical protein